MRVCVCVCSPADGDTCVVPLYDYPSLFIHPLVSGLVGCFHFLATMNNAAINILVSFGGRVSSVLLDIYPEWIPRVTGWADVLAFPKQSNQFLLPAGMHESFCKLPPRAS